MEQQTSDIDRCLAGDRGAFDRLAATYVGPIRGFLHRMVGDFHLAQDLTQETFLRAFSSIGRLASPAAFRAWLFRIAFRVAVDHHRCRDNRAVSLDGLERPVLDGADSPLQRLERSEEAERLYEAVVRAVARLPERYALLVVLRYLYQRPCLEVAGLLDLSVSNVKVRLHRARKFIRHRVAAEVDAVAHDLEERRVR